MSGLGCERSPLEWWTEPNAGGTSGDARAGRGWRGWRAVRRQAMFGVRNAHTSGHSEENEMMCSTSIFGMPVRYATSAIRPRSLDRAVTVYYFSVPSTIRRTVGPVTQGAHRCHIDITVDPAAYLHILSPPSECCPPRSRQQCALQCCDRPRPLRQKAVRMGETFG